MHSEVTSATGSIATDTAQGVAVLSSVASCPAVTARNSSGVDSCAWCTSVMVFCLFLRSYPPICNSFVGRVG
jgi:hypothetical protein